MVLFSLVLAHHSIVTDLLYCITCVLSFLCTVYTCMCIPCYSTFAHENFVSKTKQNRLFSLVRFLIFCIDFAFDILYTSLKRAWFRSEIWLDLSENNCYLCLLKYWFMIAPSRDQSDCFWSFWITSNEDCHLPDVTDVHSFVQKYGHLLWQLQPFTKHCYGIKRLSLTYNFVTYHSECNGLLVVVCVCDYFHIYQELLENGICCPTLCLFSTQTTWAVGIGKCMIP
jgi:hypothetical protein